VVGGARMGQAVAETLGRRGCRIAVGYRQSQTAAMSTLQHLRSLQIAATSFRCDLDDPTSIKAAVKTLGETYGRVDCLVNLASIYLETPRDPQGALDSWDRHLSANARGAYALTRAAEPLLRAAGSARVIHISDWTAASGRPRYPEYSAYFVSKAALKAAVEVLALELAPDILVNAIAPGPMLPPPGMDAVERAAVEKATPLRRWGGAEEIAKAVLFLAETDFVTGETIRVDGGRHLF
jgi:NAD(P)-dependent dehydrogenase (short-subunit alcohol dehydrogenase family)